jgi:hypothetical protein
VKVLGPVKVNHFIAGSIRVGLFVNKLKANKLTPSRWTGIAPKTPNDDGLVQIQS